MQPWLCLRMLLIYGAMLCGNFALVAVSADDANQLTFERDIRPIFREYCFDCHGATKDLEGGLDLRLVHLMQAGGDSGTAIIAGNAVESLVFQRVLDGEMPPGEAHVAEEKIAILKAWIETGAKTLRPEPESLPPGIPITEEERAYWAYQPIARPEAISPELTATDNLSELQKYQRARIRNPIDALLAAAMPAGLTFSDDANRATLVQRVYFDLLGLPPTKAQLDHWLNCTEPDWYEQLVEEALRSPHYGERWARHWLDAAGYADSEGHTINDATRPWAWRYRDYVIRSFNEDKPFDQFIHEQLAGDELAGPKQGDWTKQQIELLTATGFLRMAADGTGSGDDSPEARNKTIADTLQIVGSTLLGASLNCAQCHDHRYDPISHHDYFAIRAIFEPALDWQAWRNPSQRLVSLYTEADRAKAAELEQQVQAIAAERATKQDEFMKQALEQELTKYPEPLRAELRSAYETPADQRTAEQKTLLDQNPSVNISPGVLYQYLPKAAEELKNFDTRINEIRAQKPAEQFIHALVEPAGHQPVTKLFHRGDHNQPTEEVQPGVLSITVPEGASPALPANDPGIPTTGRRLAFAKWLTTSNNPLTARAIVNRIWLHHFGRGIVATPGEFGVLGAEPSHPELLDWLADELMCNDWSLKHLHRAILLSTAWRQSSQRDPVREAIDPENRYYWRKSLQRMDAEVMRDSVLATAGKLDLTPFGPPVPISEDDTGQVRVEKSQPRRSIYVTQRRSQPVALLQAFDAPVMSVNCDVRPVSTVATQALVLLNGEFSVEQAEHLAELASQDAASEQAKHALPEGIDWASKMLPSPAPRWLYGTGVINEELGQIESFEALPHFTGQQWQGSDQLPDPTFGWVLLRADSGHPGGKGRPAIRRWIVPVDGEFSLQAQLSHASEHGDGVRSRVFINQDRIAAEWRIHNGQVDTALEPIKVQAGETVDFVTDCLETETSDSFTWPLTLTFQPAAGSKETIQVKDQFRGPSDRFESLPVWIAAAWEKILLRSPNTTEMQQAIEFANGQLELLQSDSSPLPAGRSEAKQVLINICQMLINSNEFIYIE